MLTSTFASPRAENRSLTPHLAGAPNFRRVDGLPVYGVAITTADGMRAVLEAVGGVSRPVLWHSMREEPLTYVNGQPYVLREVERPFSNLELTGVSGERVEAMEARLAVDVQAEAAAYGGRLLVSAELDDGRVTEQWVTVESVQTPASLAASLAAEGYPLSYVRIPITDEKAPKGRDCDAIATRCAAASADTALIFNCQMGRGRTTTAMVVATLVTLRLHPGSDTAVPVAVPQLLPDAPDAALLRGDYAVIRSLLRVVENGREAKAAADAAIDRCSAMQNLREAVLTYRRGLNHEADEKRREAALARGVEYLER